MTYAKPELVALTHAVEAIQGSGKGGNNTEMNPPQKTPPAYEADE